MFRFYKTILNLKTRLQEQNLKKNTYIFSLLFKPVHLLQNYFKNEIYVLQNAFILNSELNFLKGDTNLYFKQITFSEKKRFCKNDTYFFLKNKYFFQLSFATFEQPYSIHEQLQKD